MRSVLVILLLFPSLSWSADLGPLFPILKNSDSTSAAPDTCTIGTAAASKNGPIVFDSKDASGNLIIPTTSSYSSQIPRDVAEVHVGSTSSTVSTVTLATANTAQTLLSSNSLRKSVYIINTSGATIYIGLGFTPTKTNGIPLVNNTNFIINYTNLWLGSISAVAGSNNRAVYIVETQ